MEISNRRLAFDSKSESEREKIKEEKQCLCVFEESMLFKTTDAQICHALCALVHNSNTKQS